MEPRPLQTSEKSTEKNTNTGASCEKSKTLQVLGGDCVFMKDPVAHSKNLFSGPLIICKSLKTYGQTESIIQGT